MSTSTAVQLTGVLVAQPATPGSYATSLQELLNLGFCATYGATKDGVVPVNSTDPSPFTIPFEGITKGRVFGMRLLSGATMKLKITTAQGTAVIPVSGVMVIHSPNPGDEITAIQLVGTGDVQYVLSGDVT